MYEVRCQGSVSVRCGVRVWCEGMDGFILEYIAAVFILVCFHFKMSAVGLLLQPEPSADSEPVLAAKRRFAETGDALGALSLMPWSKVRERMVLKALHRHGHTQVGGRGAACLNLPLE